MTPKNLISLFAFTVLLQACSSLEQNASENLAQQQDDTIKIYELGGGDKNFGMSVPSVDESEITMVSAVIRWKTDIEASSMIVYMSDLVDFAKNVDNRYKIVNDPVTDHALTATDLEPGKIYRYQVRSCDPADNDYSNDWQDCQISDVYEFTTKTEDSPPPSSLVDCSKSTVRCVGPSQEYNTQGSGKTPREWIQVAVDAAVPGDVVQIYPNINGSAYDINQKILIFKKSGSASLPIIVRGTDRDDVILDGSNLPCASTDTTRCNMWDTNVIVISESKHVILENLTARNSIKTGVRVSLSPFTTVRGIVSHNNGKDRGASDMKAWGIVTDYSDDITIVDSVFHHNSEHGIYHANSADRAYISGNDVYGNLKNGIQFNGDCRNCSSAYAPGGCDFEMTDNIIENNRVHHNGWKGFSMISAPKSLMRNNVIYSNRQRDAGAGGIHLTDEPGCGKSSSDCTLVNNTIVEPEMKGIYMTDGATRTVIFNNISVSGDSPIQDDVGGNFIDSTSNIKSGSSTGLFANAAGFDFRLVSSSIARNKGKVSYQTEPAPLDDVLGVSRPMGGAHDAGAFEFVE